MKNAMIMIAAIVSGILAVIFLEENALTASAATEFQISTASVPYSYFTDNNVTLAGDTNPDAYFYRVTVYVIDGNRYSVGGIQVEFDTSNYFLVKKPNGTLYAEQLGVFSDCNAVFTIGKDKNNVETGFVGCAFNGNQPIGSPSTTEIEPMFCFFVYCKNKADLENNPSIGEHIIKNVNINQLLDSGTHGLTEEELEQAAPKTVTVISYEYMVGDIDGDNQVGLFDSNYLLQLIAQYSDLSVDNPAITLQDIKGLGENFKGLVFFAPEIGEFIVLRVCDVNNDGVIDKADSIAILTYYANTVLAGEPPAEDEIIGTIVRVSYEVPLN